MSSLLKHKGYLGTVQYSEEDNVLHGKVAGIRSLISYEGTTLEELKNDFIEAVDFYLESCEADGRQPNEVCAEELKRELSKNTEKLLENYVAV